MCVLHPAGLDALARQKRAERGEPEGRQYIPADPVQIRFIAEVTAVPTSMCMLIEGVPCVL